MRKRKIGAALLALITAIGVLTSSASGILPNTLSSPTDSVTIGESETSSEPGSADETSAMEDVSAADDTLVSDGTSVFDESSETTEPAEIETVTVSVKSRTETSAVVTWEKSGNTNAVYDIAVNSSTVATDVTGNEYNITGLTAGQTYNVVVTAKSESGSVIGTSEEFAVHTNLVITTATAIFEDTVVGDLYINNGSLNLNTHALHVTGNLILYNGTLTIGGGSLTVDGDFCIQSESVTSNGAKSYSNGYGHFYMTNPDDYVLVNGDFYDDSYYSHNGHLTKGTLEIKGNFNHLTSYSYGSKDNFYATGEHKTILSGDKLQTVTFAGTTSKFAILELKNTSDEGVVMKSALFADKIIVNDTKLTLLDNSTIGWTLQEDEVIDGDLGIGGGILDLNGHTLTVNGNFAHTGGILKMANDDDHLIVNGNFTENSAINQSGYLTAGVIEVKSNFAQSSASYYNFRPSGTNKVLLNGNGLQTVTFATVSGTSYSFFNELEIANTSKSGVTFATSVCVVKKLYNTDSFVTNSSNIYLDGNAEVSDNYWRYDLRINSNRTFVDDLEIGGTLYIDNGSLNLNEKKLNIGGNLVLYQGTLYVNGGSIFVKGDFRIQNESIASDKTKTYSTSYGYLRMINPKDYVRVDGTFATQAYYSHSGYLTEGTLEVKKYFYQYSGNSNNFLATGNHRVVLNGGKLQRVSFDSTSSQFNFLEITKPLNTGYIFSRNPLWNTLVEKPQDTVPPTNPTELKSTKATASVIYLEWTASGDDTSVDGYDVYRDGKRVGYSAGTKYVDAGLNSDTLYTYYVVAYDIARNLSDKSNILEAETDVDLDAPTVPTSLAIKSRTADSVDLAWGVSTDNVKVSGYNIYRNDTLIKTVIGTSFTDKNIVPGDYTYYVKAFDNVNNLSKPSNTVFYDNQPPSTPVLSLTGSTLTSVSLIWESNDSVGVKGYNLYRDGTKIATITANNYVDKSVQESKTYVYAVEAYDTANNISEKSNSITVSTEVDTVAPQIYTISPSGVRLSKEANIAVTARDNTSVKSVKIQISRDKTEWSDVTSIATSTGRATETVNYKLNLLNYDDGLLYIRGIATDLSGNENGTTNTFISEIFVDNTPPAAPQNIRLESGGNRIEIKWDKSTDADIASFNVYRNTGDEFEAIVTNHKYLNYFDNNAELGKSYDYKIAAVDTAGNVSGFSDIVTGELNDDVTKPEILSVVPKDGTTIMANQKFSVSCYDNYKLKLFEAYTAQKNSNEWTKVSTQNLSEYSQIAAFNLDTSELTGGDYKAKFVLTDFAGNVSDEKIVNFTYVACTLSNPELTATPGGYKVELNWTMENSTNLIGFNVLRKSAALENYQVIAKITANSYTDETALAGKKYRYLIQAVDKYNNIVSSEELTATPTYADQAAPTANAGIDLLAIQDTAVKFDGSGSTDNHHIAAYEWDFGDGTTSDSVKPSHTYTEKGVYNVTLKVYDESENSDTAQIKINVLDKNYNVSEFQIVDSKTKQPLTNAMVYGEFGGNAQTFKTDTNGKAEVIALKGQYTLYFYKNEYLPVSKTYDLKAGFAKTVVELNKDELITGEVTVERLNIDEIKDLGIDINNPDNQYVYNYELTASDSANTGKPVELIINSFGEIIQAEVNGKVVLNLTDDTKVPNENEYSSTVKWSGTTSNGGTSTTYAKAVASENNVPIITLLTISSDISWLKEFYNVSLSVTNNASDEFNISNSIAEISLPTGLSLAETNGTNGKIQQLGTVGGHQTATASWIVRGDTAGEYDIEVSFKGLLMPFGEKVSAVFKPDEPIKVNGGTALKFEVSGRGQDGKKITVDFEVKNVSDIPVYNINFGAVEYTIRHAVGDDYTNIADMTLEYSNGVIEVVSAENGEKTVERFLPALGFDGTHSNTLNSGDSIKGSYTIWLN